ncbi:MAG TPA: hypothetical protein VJS92_10690, partial [Candidatus Polarisedimenticolaceae bacterium]|nr:hypothetical protein [Candidatus Polarisedimenticolaceae bacterium]
MRVFCRILGALCATTAVLAGSDAHKAVVPPGVLDGARPGVELLEDYGSYRLYRLTDAALAALSAAARAQLTLADEMDVIRLDARALDTREPAPPIPARLAAPRPAG